MALSIIDLPLGHDLVANFFDHRHWWLHTVVHAVLIGGPISFLVLAAVICLKTVRLCLKRPSRRPDSLPIALDTGSAFDKGVFQYLLSRTGRSQLWLLIGALATLPVLYATLELPKVIINGAIGSGHFPEVYAGVTVTQINYLVALCLLYLVAVLTGSALKYAVNLSKGRVAEALLRRLRSAVLRIWRRGARSDGDGQLIPIIVQELEVIGGFSADILALPVLQGGTFLTILTFMLVQEPILGAAAITLLPIQLVIIPRLQRRLNALGRTRALEVRRLGQLLSAVRTGRTVDDLIPIHGCFRRIQSVRNEIYQRKFLMKSALNLLQHMTPFLFYTVGGYLVIEGRLSLGALIAVLAAYKDLTSPLRELFNYYQRLEDVRVRYKDLQLALSRRHRPVTCYSGDNRSAAPGLGEISNNQLGAVSAPPIEPFEYPERTSRSLFDGIHRSAMAHPSLDRHIGVPGPRSSADTSLG
ncbi:ABC transporter ATP-binding protein [Thalassobaculum sp.]|uniref:ABC transporter ATP-binding protein n=1 Tax=Thalassobaculum sp. TaxID=2022740 RepID=UPI0032ECD6B2